MARTSLVIIGCLIAGFSVAELLAQSSSPQAGKDCQACTAGDCTVCSMADAAAAKAVNLTAEVCTGVNCGQSDCHGAGCKACDFVGHRGDCPHCQAETKSQTARVQMRVASSTSQSELANNRAELAAQLAKYLTTESHDAEHIRQVLHLSLEVTAENAHLAALASQSKNITRESMELRADQSLGLMRQTLVQQLHEMRQMFSEMQANLNGLSSTVQQLRQQAAHGNALDTAPHAPHAQWVGTQHPPHAQADLIQHLQQRIRVLEDHLLATRPVDSRRTPWQTGSLRPIQSASMPLAPINQPPARLAPRSNTPLASAPSDLTVTGPSRNRSAAFHRQPLQVQSYYVADVLAPPFATSVLQLIQTIKSRVAPESWDHSMIEIAGPAVTLVIAQTPENHQRIVQLLKQFNQDTSWATDPEPTSRQAVYHER